MNGKGSFGGQVVIVTGGSSGIGKATCLALAKAGAHIVLIGQDPLKVQTIAAEVEAILGGGEVIGLVLDVTSEADMDQMARQTLDRFNRIDALVACAGIGRGKVSKNRLVPFPLIEMPVQEWDEVLDVNLKGVFLSNRAVLPAMIQQRSGSIINVSSARAGRYGSPYVSAYCASKFGVIGFSESLKEECEAYGIKVYILLPDATDTPMLNEAGAAVNLGKALSATQVAELILFLLALPADTCIPQSHIFSLYNHGRPPWARGRINR